MLSPEFCAPFLSCLVWLYGWLCCELPRFDPSLLLLAPPAAPCFLVKAPPVVEIKLTGAASPLSWLFVFENIFSSSFLWVSGSLPTVLTFGVIKLFPALPVACC